jgi:hypothetical protein
MLGRPRDLPGRMTEPPRETITLPLSAARLKAREILDLQPQGDTHRSLRIGDRFRMVRSNSLPGGL